MINTGNAIPVFRNVLKKEQRNVNFNAPHNP